MSIEGREGLLQRQIERLDGRLAALRRLSSRLSHLRLILFLGAAAFLISVFLTTNWWNGLAGLALLAGFVTAVARHRRVDTTINQFAAWQQIKRTHLARLRLDWDTLPPAPPIPPQF
ncbi:MAG: hypothetical protein ACE5EY_12630, partial [Anaerolineae bacterium]